jgi:hypothetical protein
MVLPSLQSTQSNGRGGAEWMSALSNAGVQVAFNAEKLLTEGRLLDNAETAGREYTLECIRADEFEYTERTTENIRRLGTDGRNLAEPPAKLAALLSKTLTVEDLKRLRDEHGIRFLLVMHEPIGANGVSNLLYVCCRLDEIYLDATWNHPDRQWHAGHGFIFLAGNS